MRIRIQDYNPTFSDLISYPAWEYALDEEGVAGQDERTVRPYLAPPPLELSGVYLLVRASFVMVGGTNFKGYIKPVQTNWINQGDFMSAALPYDFNPTIVLGREHISFQYGMKKPTREEMQRVYGFLGKKSNEISPIKFNADIKVQNCVCEGELDGFMYFDQSKDNFTDIRSLTLTDIIFVK